MKQRIRAILDDVYRLGKTDALLETNDYDALIPSVEKALYAVFQAEYIRGYAAGKRTTEDLPRCSWCGKKLQTAHIHCTEQKAKAHGQRNP